MFHAFKQRTSDKGDAEIDKHTRFKQTHLREAPVRSHDCGVDPYEKLSRMTPHHTRTPSTVERPVERRRPPTPKPVAMGELDMRASLYSSEPITINVLHSALPLRAAEALSKK